MKLEIPFYCRDSKAETYAKMWRYMESNEAHTFVQSYEEGVERVLKGQKVTKAKDRTIEDDPFHFC